MATTIAYVSGNSSVFIRNDWVAAGSPPDVELGEGWTVIGKRAFEDNTTITSIHIPASVTSIEYDAFYGTASLKTVTFAPTSKLGSIGDYAFEETALISIIIPASVTSIGEGAFYGTASLKTVTFAPTSKLETIRESAFDGTALISIIIPASVTSIENYAFWAAASLKTVTFNPSTDWDTGINIEDYTFGSTDLLTTIYIDDGQKINGEPLTSPGTLASFYGHYGDITLNPVPVPICFPAGTPVVTDQGVVRIEKIVPSTHTIRGKEIVAITASNPYPWVKHIVAIAKGALAKNVPDLDTLISPAHKVRFQGEMVCAIDLVDRCEGVTQVPYFGETLYNVLLRNHSYMTINNMTCETLSPNNIVALIYGGSYTSAEKNAFLAQLSRSIRNNQAPEYKALLAVLQKGMGTNKKRTTRTVTK